MIMWYAVAFIVGAWVGMFIMALVTAGRKEE
jgi:hypothetical protein